MEEAVQDDEMARRYKEIADYFDEMNLLLCPDKWSYCTDNPIWLDLVPVLEKLEQYLEKVRNTSDEIRYHHRKTEVPDFVKIRLAPNDRRVKHKSKANRPFRIMKDEWLFMNTAPIISTEEVEVEEQVERNKYEIMVKCCPIIKRYIDNPIRGSKMLADIALVGILAMLCENLDRHFDTVRRIKYVHQYGPDVLPAIMPTTATGSMFVLISSMANEPESPLRTIIDMQK